MRIPLEKTKNNKKTLHASGHAQPPLPDHTSDSLSSKVFLFFFGFLDWNLHIPASTLGFFNLFWFGHAPPPRPEHTSDSPGPKVFFVCFFGFLDWNLHLQASTLGFFNLFWFGHAPPPRPAGISAWKLRFLLPRRESCYTYSWPMRKLSVY